MAANDVWLLTVRGLVSSTMHIHTLHFAEGVASAPVGDALLDKYSGAPLTAYRAMFEPADKPVMSLKAEKVCGATPLPSPVERIPVAASQIGTKAASGGNPMPSFVACVVQEKGTLAGRRYSGRFFLGGVNENDVSGNVLDAPYITRVTAYCTALTTAFITGPPADFRLWSFSGLLANGDPNHTSRNPVPGGARISTPVTAVPCVDAGSPVASFVINGQPTTMRSRKLGHGL